MRARAWCGRRAGLAGAWMAWVWQCACVVLVHGGTCWKRRVPDLKSLGGQTPCASSCARGGAQRRLGSGRMSVACAARWRVDGGGWCVCVCRVGAWRHMLEAAEARSQESRQANAVRPILRHGRRPAPPWKRQGAVMCATCWRVTAGVWQSARVSRWCMAAHAGSGERPFSRVSAGKRRALHPAPDGVGRAANMKRTSQYSIDRGRTIV